MAILELVGSQIEFPAQQFLFLFFTDSVSNGRASGTRVRRWQGRKNKRLELVPGTPVNATRHVATFSVSLGSKFNTCTTQSLAGPSSPSRRLWPPPLEMPRARGHVGE